MEYLLLCFEFLKTGLFAIGGGLATLPFLYDMADNHTWFSRDVLADMIAVSESTPGPIGINMATYAGYNMGGILGALLATVSLLVPSIIIVLIMARFLSKFKDNQYINAAFYGIRPTVTALISVAAVEIIKISILTIDQFVATQKIQNLFHWKALALFVVLYFIGMYSKKLHPFFLILLAGITGVAFGF